MFFLIPMKLLELLREVRQVVGQAVGVCRDPQLQHKGLRRFRTLPQSRCFPLHPALSSRRFGEQGARQFSTVVNWRKGLEGRGRQGKCHRV